MSPRPSLTAVAEDRGDDPVRVRGIGAPKRRRPAAYAIGGTIAGGILEVAGSSIEAGANLPTRTDRYSAIVAELLGLTEQTVARSGSSLSRDSILGSVGQYAESRQRFATPDRSKGPSSSAYFPVASAGIVGSPVNDLTGVGTTGFIPPTPKTFELIKQSVRSLIVDRVRSSAIDCLDSRVVYSGTWATKTNQGPTRNTNGAGADSSGSGYRYSSTQGDYFEVPIPGDYPGSLLAPFTLQMVGYPTTDGQATLTASGASSGTLDASADAVSDLAPLTVGQPARAGGYVWRFAGTAPTSPGYIAPSNGTPQTLRITLSSIVNAQRVAFDRAIVEAHRDYAPRVAVVGVHKQNPFALLTMAVLDNQDVEDSNDAIKAVVAEFGPHVAYIDADGLFGGLGRDGSGQGEAKLALALSSGATAAKLDANAASKGFQIGDYVMLGWQEVVRITSILADVVSSMERGLYNTAKGSWNVGTDFRKVNPDAIECFFDGLHPSGFGHYLLAQAVASHLAPGIQVEGDSARRRSGSRSDLAVSAFCSYPTVAYNGIAFDTVLHDSLGAMDVGIAENQKEIPITADGTYRVRVPITWEAAAAGGGQRLATLKAITVDEAGAPVTRSLASSSITAGPNAFWQPADVLNWEGNLKVGDKLRVDLAASAGLSSVNLTAAINDTVTTIPVQALPAGGIAAGTYVKVDDESILVNGAFAAGATSLTGVTRAAGGLKAAHANGSPVKWGAGILAGSKSQRDKCDLSIKRVGPYFGAYN